uniref:Uncharacterized protein MANES_13G088500 n=1 Tax=Rhizophora mucronata TaxID=61149 RepID=A0A2P2JN54_RHIMU
MIGEGGTRGEESKRSAID